MNVLHAALIRKFIPPCHKIRPADNTCSIRFVAALRQRSTMATKVDTAPQDLNFIQRIKKDGTAEWVVASEDYDYNQEIARAAYADMLHDHNRNIRYYEAIRAAIYHRHAEKKKAIVLDIGTGTGLLSMMALAAGADTVFACEAFKPMATCADKVLRRNNYRDRVLLIPKRSTELEVGEGKDMPVKANILVAEVFDTELIGEGAIEVFNHAKRELTTDDCFVIPARAKVIAQVVSWPMLSKWNQLQDFHSKESGPASSAISIKYPSDLRTRTCAGVPSVHDLQLTEAKGFTRISSELVVYEFNWSKIQPLTRKNSIPFQARDTVESYGIFLWWDLTMFECASPIAEENLLTCRPNWTGEFCWRDHWMQAAYYLPPDMSIERSSMYMLECAHDEFSFWFKVNSTWKLNEISLSPRLIEDKHPVCTCGLHLAFSRSRFGLLNDEKRRNKFLNCLRKTIKPSESVVLVISDGSYLGIMAAKLQAKKVFIVETDPAIAKITKSFLNLNGLEAMVLNKTYTELTPEDFSSLKIDVVVGDPYFQAPAQPWNHLVHWRDALTALSWCFSSDVKIEPSSAQFKCVLMDFDHLWKINAPVGKVCGFDLTDFDELIEKSSDFADTTIDSQPLWEYPGTVRSEEMLLETVDFQELATGSKQPSANGLPPAAFLTSNEAPNGLAIWIEYNVGGEVVSTGFDPYSKPSGALVGKKLDWDLNWKQGVYFFKGKDLSNFDLGAWWQAARL